MQTWGPLPQEDQEAANKKYDAVITRMVSANRYRVRFVHAREDPLVRPDEPAHILYAAFSNFPGISICTFVLVKQVSVLVLW
jgi:hypothetical protein